MEEASKPVDIVAVAASAFFGVPVEQVTPEMREKAKTLTFSLRYGQMLTTAAQLEAARG